MPNPAGCTPCCWNSCRDNVVISRQNALVSLEYDGGRSVDEGARAQARAWANCGKQGRRARPRTAVVRTRQRRCDVVLCVGGSIFCQAQGRLFAKDVLDATRSGTRGRVLPNSRRQR